MSTFEKKIPVASIPLNSGYSIPQLGYGLYKIPDQQVTDLVGQALEVGYRHLDSAAFYQNESGVGQALSRAFSSGLERKELFVTSKVWNTEQGFERTVISCEKTLHDLNLDYLDLFLIHWPCPQRQLFLETWKALEYLQAEGRVRSIGVSNFRVQDLESIVGSATVIPAVNQIELHPWLQQKELVAMHRELGIKTQAWSPLARGRVLEDPVLVTLAKRYGVSVAQLVLRWHMQLGVITFPKASHRGKMQENANIFGFELLPEDMDLMAGLDRNFRSGSHPDRVN